MANPSPDPGNNNVLKKPDASCPHPTEAWTEDIRFRALYENATLGLYRTTPEGRILLVNPTLLRMLGYDSFEELMQRNLEQEGYAPTYPRQEFRTQIERDGQITGLEAAWTRADGSVIYVRESATAIRDAEGKTIYYEGTVEDITDRKQAEEALKQSEARYRTVFEQSPLGIAMVSPEGQFLSANLAFVRCWATRRRNCVG
ncbi:MAG TPA: PAS domain S-box protein [Clostridia bacterium]|nr:PAS domain S-box protein [Clostridia bacterium]